MNVASNHNSNQKAVIYINALMKPCVFDKILVSDLMTKKSQLLNKVAVNVLQKKRW